MSEKQVTVDGTTRKLDPPFLVLATQNPYEFEGTYPLPESQLDRFLLRLSVGYPERAAERLILTSHRAGEPVDSLAACLTVRARWSSYRRRRGPCGWPSRWRSTYSIWWASTRSHPSIRLGASTRAALAFYRAVQAHALISRAGLRGALRTCRCWPSRFWPTGC